MMAHNCFVGVSNESTNPQLPRRRWDQFGVEPNQIAALCENSVRDPFTRSMRALSARPALNLAKHDLARDHNNPIETRLRFFLVVTYPECEVHTNKPRLIMYVCVCCCLLFYINYILK